MHRVSWASEITVAGKIRCCARGIARVEPHFGLLCEHNKSGSLYNNHEPANHGGGRDVAKLPRVGMRARYAFAIARTVSSSATGRSSKTIAWRQATLEPCGHRRGWAGGVGVRRSRMQRREVAPS